MYSKNDYRNYLEHRLMESGDYFAHWGVKGMKWRHHKSQIAFQDAAENALWPVGGRYYSPNDTRDRVLGRRVLGGHSEIEKRLGVSPNMLRTDNATRIFNGKQFERQQRKGIARDTELLARDAAYKSSKIAEKNSSAEKARKKALRKKKIDKAKKKVSKIFERENLSGSKKIGKNLYVTGHTTTITKKG